MANILVCGPPGSGKTTYVREHKHAGDLVIDQDAMFVALALGEQWYDNPKTLFPLVVATCDYVTEMAAASAAGRRLSKHIWYGAWRIAGVPQLDKRRAMARNFRANKVVVLEVSTSICLQRIAADRRRDWRQWEPVVKRWWRQYEPDEEDVRIDDLGRTKG